MKKLLIALPFVILSSCANFNKPNEVAEKQNTKSEIRKISSSDSDSFAVISCPYTIYYHDGGSGIKIKNQEGKWSINYTDCADGDRNYSVTLVQNKILNLDFLRDKDTRYENAGAPGVLKLQCIGTEVKGIYKAGAFAGLGLFVAGRVGIFASIKGGQAVCTVIDGKIDSFGVELSPYSLEIR